jgi:hypothetical protein
MLCIALQLNAQRDWVNYHNQCPIIDNHDWMRAMSHDDEFSYVQNYKPDMLVKESRKTRRKLRKARRGKKRLAKTNFKVVSNRKKLAITAYIDAEDKKSYHLKLTNKKGKVIKSYLHLSPKTIQEIQLMQLMPGKYELSLYAGIERRLMSRYKVNRY